MQFGHVAGMTCEEPVSATDGQLKTPMRRTSDGWMSTARPRDDETDEEEDAEQPPDEEPERAEGVGHLAQEGDPRGPALLRHERESGGVALLRPRARDDLLDALDRFARAHGEMDPALRERELVLPARELLVRPVLVDRRVPRRLPEPVRLDPAVVVAASHDGRRREDEEGLDRRPRGANELAEEREGPAAREDRQPEDDPAREPLVVGDARAEEHVEERRGDDRRRCEEAAEQARAMPRDEGASPEALAPGPPRLREPLPRLLGQVCDAPVHEGREAIRGVRRIRRDSSASLPLSEPGGVGSEGPRRDRRRSARFEEGDRRAERSLEGVEVAERLEPERPRPLAALHAESCELHVAPELRELLPGRLRVLPLVQRDLDGGAGVRVELPEPADLRGPDPAPARDLDAGGRPFGPDLDGSDERRSSRERGAGRDEPFDLHARLVAAELDSELGLVRIVQVSIHAFPAASRGAAVANLVFEPRTKRHRVAAPEPSHLCGVQHGPSPDGGAILVAGRAARQPHPTRGSRTAYGRVLRRGGRRQDVTID